MAAARRALAKAASGNTTPVVGIDDDVARITRLRIRQARETLAAIDRIYGQPPSAENVIAFHELHARHLRELGDEQGAARADERAHHARTLSRPPRDP